MAYMEGARALIGKEISAKNKQTIQTAHDALHESHDALTAMGADCPGALKAAELKAACRCQGEGIMSKADQVKTILALGTFTDEQKAEVERLPDANVAHLATLAAKSPADALIQAKFNADAGVAAHGHALNMQDVADKNKKDAAAKKKAAMDANGGKDPDADDDDPDAEDDSDEPDVKTAKAHRRTLKAAAAAGLSVEDFQEQEWLKTAPKRFRDMAANDKAAKAARKTELVAALKGGPLTDKQLEAKPVEELETLAAFAGIKPKDETDYSGRGLPELTAAQGDVYRNPPNAYDEAIKRERAKSH
jgi:hypothetical protein